MARERQRPRRSGSQNAGNINFNRLLRDVLVASLNKGQFPFAMVGIIAIVLIWRMPKEVAGALATDLLGRVADGSILGYIFALVLGGGWLVHAQSLRRQCRDEMERISAERNLWQKRALGGDLQSSEES